MCECSKGYTCPQHVARVNANAKPQTVAKRPKGMTINRAVAVMKNNRSVRKVFARNEETKKAARILMGAYYSSGERGCPSLQQIVDKFSVTVASPKDAKASITAHKNKPFNIGDIVQAVASPGNGLSNTGYFTVGEKFVVKEVATSQNTVKLVGKDGYWDKSRFELVDNEWVKLVDRIAARSFTIERVTLTTSSATLLKNVVADDISACLNKSGFPEISSVHVYLPKPIAEIGYYKVLLSFPGGSQGWANVWVVPV